MIRLFCNVQLNKEPGVSIFMSVTHTVTPFSQREKMGQCARVCVFRET